MAAALFTAQSRSDEPFSGVGESFQPQSRFFHTGRISLKIAMRELRPRAVLSHVKPPAPQSFEDVRLLLGMGGIAFVTLALLLTHLSAAV